MERKMFEKMGNSKRKLFEFGKDWDKYTVINPMFMVKTCHNGGMMNNGKETIIFDKGDYLVTSSTGNMTKYKAADFDKLFINKYCTRRIPITLRLPSFWKRLKLLFSSEITLNVKKYDLLEELTNDKLEGWI